MRRALLLLIFPSLLALAEDAPCTPARPGTTVDVGFKKGAKLKDLAAWYRRVTCQDLQAPLNASDTPLGLVMEGKIAAGRALEVVRAAAASAGYDARVELRKVTLEKSAEPCDAARTRDLLARVAAAPSCHLDLDAFGCVDGKLRLEPAGGKLRVAQLDAESPLWALGLREGDELVDDKAALLELNPEPSFALKIVRGGVTKALRCEVAGQQLRFHPMTLLQAALSSGTCSFDPAAVGKRGDVVEVDSAKLPGFDFDCLLRTARIVPTMRDGRAEGLKLYGIRPNTLPTLVGLANGDTVKTVNGVSVGSPDQAMEVFRRLRSEKKFTIAFERRGEPKVLTIVVK
ncbi:MAG: hypothetical protein ACO1OB_21230 [Archangium sp.]